MAADTILAHAALVRPAHRPYTSVAPLHTPQGGTEVLAAATLVYPYTSYPRLGANHLSIS